MRILDDDSDRKLDTISIFLTKTEAEQMIGYLSDLIEDLEGSTFPPHSHFSSEDYQKEITLSVYNPEGLKGFS
ncbi:MAG: hypothetical protein L7U87_05430, partial [Chlamydiales bacterium]|nr:hypothetical protein [Chlamydiales bacterium]